MNKKYRKAIIAGNWKMNMLPSEVKPFTEELRPLLPRQKTCEVALCVPATHISPLRRSLKDSRIAVGAEDVSVHESGAFTGEVSADMLSDLGVHYVIVGHSERRAYHNETDFMVGEKAAAVLDRWVSVTRSLAGDAHDGGQDDGVQPRQGETFLKLIQDRRKAANG